MFLSQSFDISLALLYLLLQRLVKVLQISTVILLKFRYSGTDGMKIYGICNSLIIWCFLFDLGENVVVIDGVFKKIS